MATRTRASVEASESSLNEIRYWIYDANTATEYKGSQTLAEAGEDFGKLKISLTTGTRYYILFWGFNGNHKDGSFYFDAPEGYSSSTYFSAYDKDVFYKYVNESSIAITSATKNIDVELTRITGELVVQLTDTEIPNDIASVDISFYRLTSYYPDWGQARNMVELKKNFVKDGASFKPIDLFLLPEPTARPLQLTAYDASKQAIGTATVYVPIYSNRRSVVTGSLANIFSGKEFSVKVDEEWGSDYNVTIE